MKEQHLRITGFLMELVSRYRWMVFFWLLANVSAGVLEGASMSLLYAAISVLMGKGLGSVAGTMEWLRDNAGQVVLGLDNNTVFLVLVSLVAVTQVMQSGLFFAGFGISAALRMRVRRFIMNKLVGHIMDLSFSEVSRSNSGELWTHITLGKGMEKLIGLLNDGIYTALMALAYLLIMLWLSWQMTLAALLLAVVLSIGLRPVMRNIHRFANDNLRIMQQMNNKTADILGGMRLIRSFGLEKNAKDMMNDYITRSSLVNMHGTLWEGTITPIIDVMTYVTLAIAVAAISLIYGVDVGEVLPRVLIFIFVLARLMPRLGHLNKVRAGFHSAWPVVGHIVDFLRTDNKSMSRKGGIPCDGINDGIEFRNVTLCYPNTEKAAVQELNFRIPAGTTIALVGESGAGKSSVVDLTLGLFSPTEGDILVDGVSLESLELGSWRRRIGVVSQDTFLFPGSIHDNIAFGRPDASGEEVITAARVAHAHEFITELERGYDTVIGERGYRLSGGQCQRLALARAFLRDPDLLILDEATSDLDSLSERLIQDALQNFGKDRTVIIVAHRLSTVRNADEILVLSRGRINERGRHEQLLSENGIYARLWGLQAMGSDVDG